MEWQNNGQRFEPYKKWEKTYSPGYDYGTEGVAKHILSKPIVESQNPIMKLTLKIYDSCIIFMLKSIDILKNFKNVHWKNR